MINPATDETLIKDDWIKEFWAEREKEAAAAGMHVLQYMAQAEGGILKGTMAKLLLHAKAHPDVCPADCSFQASIKKLKEEYGVE